MSYFSKNVFVSLRKETSVSILNIIGLSIGIAIGLLLFIYISQEKNYDTQNASYHEVFRVLATTKDAGGTETFCVTPNALSPELSAKFPEVRFSARILKHKFGEPAYLSANSNNFKEDYLYFCDRDITKILDISIIQGDRSTALTQPRAAMISEAEAKRLFGGDAIGKTFILDFTDTLVVSAVFRDFPSESSFDFNVIVPYEHSLFNKNLSWNNSSVETYCLLDQGANAKLLESKLFVYLKQNSEQQAASLHSVSLQALGDIHLHSDTYKYSFLKRVGSSLELKVMTLLAILILVIACINYVNLSTAQVEKRIKTICFKKLLGASTKQLVGEIYLEAGGLILLSALLGIGLLLLVIPIFGNVIGKVLHIGDLKWVRVAFYTLTLVVLMTFVAGSYPAFTLSKFAPVKLFDQTFRFNSVSVLFRESLLVVQFAISFVLVTFSLIIYNQMKFIDSKDLGYSSTNVIAVSLPTTLDGSKVEALETEIKKDATVAGTAIAQGIPGTSVSGRTLFKDELDKKGVSIQTNNASTGIINVLKLQLLAGSDLPLVKNPTDSTIQVILNQTAANYLGYKVAVDAIGKRINMELGKNAFITGIVRDFNYASLESKVEPYAFHNDQGDPHPYLLIRSNVPFTETVLDKIDGIERKVFPLVPFEFSFVDKFTNSLYNQYKRSQRVILSFSLIAILVTCLGLIGLMSYKTKSKEKEIAIRKIIGSDGRHIVALLLKNVVRVIIIACFLGMPIAWLFGNAWLNNFAYRESVGTWEMVVPVLIIMLISFLTIAYQTLKAVNRNPVQAMRYQ